MRHRRLVVGAWIVLTIFGALSASKINKRWLDQFSIPGYSAYEANQRTLKVFGNGAQPPHVAIFAVQGDVTKDKAIGAALGAFHRQFPEYRIGSYFTTGSRAYVSKDAHTTFATLYPPGKPGFSSNSHAKKVRAAIRALLPSGVAFHLTGRDALQDSQGASTGPSVFTEALIGGAGALIILLRVRNRACRTDADHGRDRGDSQHLHAGVGDDVSDRRLADRPVPDRARGSR